MHLSIFLIESIGKKESHASIFFNGTRNESSIGACANNYMSSDETASDASSNSGDEGICTQQGKKLRKHPAMWRSAELEEYIQSLDRKIARRRTERGKVMVLNTSIGCNSLRSAPIDCPEWAKTVFTD